MIAIPQCSITLFQYALRGDLGTYLYLVTDEDEPQVRKGYISAHTEPLPRKGERPGGDTEMQ